MDDVAGLPAADPTDLFAATAGRRKVAVEIIEKDFWVCRTLERPFAVPATRRSRNHRLVG